MPPKRKRGGGAKTAAKSPAKTTANTPKKEVKKFVPKFTEIVTRSKRRGQKNVTDQVGEITKVESEKVDESLDVSSSEQSLSQLDESTNSQDNTENVLEEVPSQEVTQPEQLSIIMDVDDSQDEFVNTEEQAELITEQLSNLEFEMSKMEVIKTHSVELEENISEEIDPEVGSEIIIECVADDIPIVGEQEVFIESDTEADEINIQFVSMEEENEQEEEVQEEIIQEEDIQEEIIQEEVSQDEIQKEIGAEIIQEGEDSQEFEGFESKIHENQEINKEDEMVEEMIEENIEGDIKGPTKMSIEDNNEDIKDNTENFKDNEEDIKNNKEIFKDNKENIQNKKEESQKVIEPKEEINSIEFNEKLIIEELNEEFKKELVEEPKKESTEESKKESIEETKKQESEEIKKELPEIKPKTQKSKAPLKKSTPKPKGKPAKKKQEKTSTNNESVRRSSRIKSITVQKQKSKGHGLVKHKQEETVEEVPTVEEKPAPPEPPKFVVPPEPQKPVKVKSRWRRSSELEQSSNLNANKPVVPSEPPINETKPDENEILKKNAEEVQRRLKQFVHLKENLYLTERISCKEAKKMTCDCFLTEEEINSGEYGCGEDCLNRLLMIECGSLCSVGDRCTNKKFQKGEFAPCEVFCTDKKGLGIRAAANIPYGEFILEYVGEVLDPEEFEKRATEYSSDKNQHYYFMALRADAVIDATQKGNISRFINHSCDPNAETQKWTVNGELRIGFYSKRTILAGEEITFDYQFQRYGKEAQKCYCEAPTCRGWLGEEPDDEDEDEDEEEDDEEEEEEESEESKVTLETKKDDEKLEKEAEKVQEETTEVIGESNEVIKEEKVVKIKKKKEKKKISRPRLPRKDIFEDADLDEEIETLQTTGLKNQAQTLKLSRLMVRAKEPAQRTKLLRVLRHGEFPCRRLFLDYHGLRLIHGWMTDAQHMVKENKKLESQRLEILQTLATLPIPNKTMLQDSKVLPTVQRWSSKSDEAATLDSDSNSPKVDTENEIKIESKIDESENIPPTVDKPLEEKVKELNEEVEESISFPGNKEIKENIPTDEPLPDYQEEIVALGLKLLDEWSVLKEVFRIPKKERIEQMKEHEREADRKYKAGLGLEQDLEKKYESRYGTIFKRRKKIWSATDPKAKDEQMTVLEKYHRRKLFALQVEQQELERRRNQQEIWRQHEQRCMTMGTDPKFTAPFDPNQGLRNTMIWNPQISQWVNYPLPNTNNANVYYPGVGQNLMQNQINQPNLFTTTQIPINKLVQTPPPNIQNKPLYVPQPQPQIMQYRPNVNYTNPNPINTQIPYSQPDLNYQVNQNGKMIQSHLVPNKPPLPTLPYQENVEDPSQVKFMGPIPPPAKLPPKWKCAKDKYGRPYYYHIRIRKAQWEPPELPPEDPDESSETSSSDTSSLSSDTSTEESDSDDEIDDARLLLQIKNKFKMMEANKADQEGDVEMQEEKNKDGKSIDSRILEEFSFLKEDAPTPAKKRRAGLVTEILISPRTEEDKLQFKEDVKRYKANKEKLKQQKEMLEMSKKQLAGKSGKHATRPQKKHKSSVKSKLKEMGDNDAMKKIKESFRSNMAVVMVSILNPYRKLECKEGRITNTEDFKHLARKLTHFVMLKELKHCQNIEDLTVTESVKSKAKEFVRKYMSKFGETYLKPKDDPEF